MTKACFGISLRRTLGLVAATVPIVIAIQTTLSWEKTFAPIFIQYIERPFLLVTGTFLAAFLINTITTRVYQMFDCGIVRLGPISFFERNQEDDLKQQSNTHHDHKIHPEHAPKKIAQNLNTKTVYLIRHAESNENHRLRCLSRSIKTLGKFSMPTKEDITTSFELIDVKAQIDSNVSEKGRKQIQQLGQRLRADNFVEQKQIQLVAHSPLIRARQTSEGMLGCVTQKPEVQDSDPSWPGKYEHPSIVKRIVELPSLMERTIFEWVPIQHDAFMNRIQEFETWLDEQAEERIAIVGHSQYFKSMLGLSYKFGNCDVWELKYTPRPLSDGTKSNSDYEINRIRENNAHDEGILPRGWSGLKQLYTYHDLEKDA